MTTTKVHHKNNNIKKKQAKIKHIFELQNHRQILELWPKFVLICFVIVLDYPQPFYLFQDVHKCMYLAIDNVTKFTIRNMFRDL